MNAPQGVFIPASRVADHEFVYSDEVCNECGAETAEFVITEMATNDRVHLCSWPCVTMWSISQALASPHDEEVAGWSVVVGCSDVATALGGQT